MRIRDELRYTTSIEFTDHDLAAFVAVLGRLEVTASGADIQTLAVLRGKLRGAKADADRAAGEKK